MLTECLRNAYGMLTECLRNAYGMLTECLRNAYGMLTRLAIAWCQLREVPDAAASQVDKMSWVAGLAEARWFRAMDVSGSGTVERAGGTTSGVQAQEHWGERAWEGASFKWVQANKIQLAYLFAWVFGDQYTVSHIHTCCDCKQETERAKREYLYGEAANSKPCYRPIGLDRAQADWNTDARAILFSCFKSFSQKQDWHGHLHGVLCQVRAQNFKMSQLARGAVIEPDAVTRKAFGSRRNNFSENTLCVPISADGILRESSSAVANFKCECMHIICIFIYMYRPLDPRSSYHFILEISNGDTPNHFGVPPLEPPTSLQRGSPTLAAKMTPRHWWTSATWETSNALQCASYVAS